MTAQQVARLMQQRAALVKTELTKTTKGLGISAVKFCKETMTREIYAIPEDVSPRTGKKKWRRTGSLRRAERMELRSPYQVAIVNDMRYAEPRHEAGKKGRRNIDPRRESHWRDELKRVFRPIEADAYRATILAVLRRRNF